MKTKSVSKIDADDDYLFSAAGSRYIAVHQSHQHIQSLSQEFGLATVFALPQDNKPQVTRQWVQERVDSYNSNDDIFDNAFLATVIFHGAQEEAVSITEQAQQYLHERGTKQIVCTSSSQLLPGPYAIVGRQLRDVWKLVDDINQTCMVTLKPRSETADAFESFRVKGSDDQCSSFALPSRTKTQAISTSVLTGMRILVKDNIHLQGIKTSVGNRAFYDTYPSSPESAECVQKLIDQGVVVLGKAKMSSFANWEEPMEHIDYQAPWNPRADLYQSPGGSSSGSAAAVATYDWLDIALGTDTWGSVTRPALWCGCYGLRPTFGAVSAHGIEPCCQTFDTAGILGRDLQKCRHFAAEWLLPDVLQKDLKPFTRTVWPVDFWKVIDSEQVSTAHRFTQQLVSHLKVDYQEVSFEKFWLKFPPEEANGCSLSEFIDEAADLQDYDAYHNCDDFRAKYWRLTGHAPYVSPPNQKTWKFAQTISKETRDIGFKRMDIYKRWFEDNILAAASDNVLIVMPIESLSPRYRDEVPNFQRPPPGVNALALAAVLNAPAVTAPIGEISYYSRITEREEKLPFAVAIMGSPGTDLTLMDTVYDVLKAVGLPTTVKTGRRMFE